MPLMSYINEFSVSEGVMQIIFIKCLRSSKMKYITGKEPKTFEGHGAKPHHWSYRQVTVVGRKADACFSAGFMWLLDTLLLIMIINYFFPHRIDKTNAWLRCVCWRRTSAKKNMMAFSQTEEFTGELQKHISISQADLDSGFVDEVLDFISVELWQRGIVEREQNLPWAYSSVWLRQTTVSIPSSSEWMR